MCETTVYLDQDGHLEKLVEDVMRVDVDEKGVTLYKLFEPPHFVAGTIRQLDALKHTLTLTSQVGAKPLQIFKRRSIRAYTSAPVTEEQVQVLLESAMAAPSANDVRPWAFIVVRDAERRKALAGIHQWSAMCAQAPLVIVVLGNPQASHHWVEDCSAATENLLLAASERDLGSVWVAVYPNLEREGRLREILKVPENLRPLCLLPVGHPAEEKPARTRYEQQKVHLETFGGT
jgi:nitroreductase/predicted RNA-binding protein